jgi:hypothetical protein
VLASGVAPGVFGCVSGAPPPPGCVGGTALPALGLFAGTSGPPAVPYPGVAGFSLCGVGPGKGLSNWLLQPLVASARRPITDSVILDLIVVTPVLFKCAIGCGPNATAGAYRLGLRDLPSSHDR